LFQVSIGRFLDRATVASNPDSALPVVNVREGDFEEVGHERLITIAVKADAGANVKRFRTKFLAI
jgi:hypothetical protein